ncbi:MAG TPA: hypothetical protein VK540_04825, partial [Polyangiaceae bacterium]|nr:hypothetical protein [Polyangiaceae bacterium]
PRSMRPIGQSPDGTPLLERTARPHLVPSRSAAPLRRQNKKKETDRMIPMAEYPGDLGAFYFLSMMKRLKMTIHVEYASKRRLDR